jgi:hypothetical protein
MPNYPLFVLFQQAENNASSEENVPASSAKNVKLGASEFPQQAKDTSAKTSQPEIIQPPLFTGHALPLRHANTQPLNRMHQDWEFFTLVFIVITFTMLKVLYNKNFRQILDAIFSVTLTNQMVRDENVLVQRASTLLMLTFNLVAAVFLYQVSVYFDWTSDFIGTGFSRFLIFAFGISSIYSLKFLVLKVVGLVFDLDKPVATYIFNIFLINNIMGVALIPMIIGIAYMPELYAGVLMKAALILVIMGFVYRLLRGIIIGISVKPLSVFYLFLYLCTLEIAPLLIISKWFD